MKYSEVPQDRAGSTYGGHKKLLYVVGEHGEYTSIQSAGWEAESTVTRAAIEEFEQECGLAWRQAKEGRVSALKYHMLSRRMDVALLAQTSGLFKWRIRRHFRPEIYNKLKRSVMTRYAEALGCDVDNLRELPDKPRRSPC